MAQKYYILIRKEDRIFSKEALHVPYLSNLKKELSNNEKEKIFKSKYDNAHAFIGKPSHSSSISSVSSQ